MEIKSSLCQISTSNVCIDSKYISIYLLIVKRSNIQMPLNILDFTYIQIYWISIERRLIWKQHMVVSKNNLKQKYSQMHWLSNIIFLSLDDFIKKYTLESKHNKLTMKCLPKIDEPLQHNLEMLQLLRFA